MPDIPDLLNRRHEAQLEWVEPWPALGPQGNHLDGYVTLRATVHDCVNIQRFSQRQATGGVTTGSDADLLSDFICIHWATEL